MVQRPEKNLRPPLWMNAKAGKQALALSLEKLMGKIMHFFPSEFLFVVTEGNLLVSLNL